MLTALGSTTGNAILIGAGYALGANWDRVSGWVGAYSDVVLAAVEVVAAIYSIVRGPRKHRNGRERRPWSGFSGRRAELCVFMNRMPAPVTPAPRRKREAKDRVLGASEVRTLQTQGCRLVDPRDVS